ncbi:hypothetical protein ACFL2Q_08175 [Thermodesulfobacteriota bacterium]
MRARLLQDDTIAVSGMSRILEFNKIWAGLGWPDVGLGYLCVVGEREDGCYHALWEKRGGLWELGEAALEAKERLLVDRIMVDTNDELSASYLRTREGLCYNEDPARVPAGTPPVNPSRYERVRSKGIETTVAPVLAPIVRNYRSALEKTREAIMTGKLFVHEGNCPIMVYTLRQPLEDLLRSPVMRALVWVVTALEIDRGSGDVGDDLQNPWYKNFSRI